MSGLSAEERVVQGDARAIMHELGVQTIDLAHLDSAPEGVFGDVIGQAIGSNGDTAHIMDAEGIIEDSGLIDWGD